MRPKTVITKLLQSVTESLLQSASGITKCDSYYEVGRNTLQSILLVNCIVFVHAKI